MWVNKISLNRVKFWQRTYTNALLQKKLILADNQGKSGVYRWTNKESGKSYIGSDANLSVRLDRYFKKTEMEYE